MRPDGICESVAEVPGRKSLLKRHLPQLSLTMLQTRVTPNGFKYSYKVTPFFYWSLTSLSPNNSISLYELISIPIDKHTSH